MRHLPTIAALLLLAPCVASAAGAFDGKYVGRITNVKQTPTCGSQNSWGGTFEVAGDKFTTNIGGGKIPLSGDVRPDGSFETTTMLSRGNNLNFAGKITGNLLHATGTSSLCEWGFDMKKSAG